MRTNKPEIDTLKEENEFLRERIEILEKEIEFLKGHPTICRGLKGERLICALTGGTLSSIQEKYDIKLKNDIKLEIKFSKLCKPVISSPSKTLRWHWGKPFGQNMNKEYDFLILIGEKDSRFLNQYFDNSPYVFFLIPMDKIISMSASDKYYNGGQLNLLTNLKKIRSPRGKEIIKYIVSYDLIDEITKNAKAY